MCPFPLQPDEDQSVAGSKAVWYCVQTRPKQEKLAASALAGLEGVEVYSPFLRIQRVLNRGKVWFLEALFPCYVFARFDPDLRSRAVGYANGVVRVLKFGDAFAEIPDRMIQEIHAEMGGQIVKEVIVTPHAGDYGEVAAGPLKGLQGVICHVNSGKARARILVELLGGLHSVDISLGSLKTPRHARDFVSISSS